MGSIFRRLNGSASAILIAILVVMATGTFSLMGLQFCASWQDLIHANRVSVLAAADRVIYEAAEIVRVSRGQVQSRLLAEEDPQASITATFARTDAQMDRVMKDIPPDLAEDTATRLAGLRTEWSTATEMREGLLAIAARPRAQRNLADTQTWFAAVGKVISDLTDLSARVAGAARVADPIVGESVLARQYAWAARDAAGDECATVRPAFGGKSPLSPAQLSQVTAARARAGQSMAALRQLLNREGAPVELVQADTSAAAAVRAGFSARDTAYATLGTANQLGGEPWE